MAYHGAHWAGPLTASAKASTAAMAVATGVEPLRRRSRGEALGVPPERVATNRSP